MKTVLVLLVLFLLPLTSCTSMGPSGRGSKGGSVVPSGLTPVFPAEISCVPVASPYGSITRYNGSSRPVGRFGGRHGGIDLSLPIGTALRAVADGKVIHRGVGGRAEGIFLWLQHSPENTGLGYWSYSKYQHLRELPEKTVGTAVKVGEIVAYSGHTGTQGKEYGSLGYPHLHLTLLAGSSEKYSVNDTRVSPEDMQFFDPIALYLEGLDDVDSVEDLPESKRVVAIPYVTATGEVKPSGRRVAWPVACERK